MPSTRIFLAALIIAACATGLSARAQERAPDSFRAFVAALWPDAQKRGVSRATFDEALRGVVPDTEVLALTKRQPEYNNPVGDYLSKRITRGLLSGGKRNADRWSKTLAAVEQKYGVDRYVIVAIWGLETNYGGFTGGKDVIRSLATLAHARYRDDFFGNELLAALEILEQEHITREKMRGSWAGAMGQAQFIPTSFLKFAVDFSGDGKRDIWSNVPDVLGSIGNYLKESGWRRGLPWGFEVNVPAGFDYMQSRGSFPDWAARGVRRADGGKLPASGQAILFFPSGAKGPAFLITGNYEAIKKYNISDAYSLAVANVADRLRGGEAFAGAWPAERPLPRERRIWLQKRMQQLGYPVSNFVGQIDFDLRDQIRLAQRKFGMLPDGNPTEPLLRELGK